MNLKQKMITGAAIVTIVPVLLTAALIGYDAVAQSRSALQAEARSKLTSLMNARKEQIETYVTTMIDQAKTFANDRMIIAATSEFAAQFYKPADTPQAELNRYKTALRRYYKADFIQEYEKRNATQSPDMDAYLNQLDSESIVWQHRYIVNNEFPLGEKYKLTDAGDGSEYSKLHATYHPHLLNYLQTFGYYDLFLVDAKKGEVIYSVFKELDYGTSLMDGPFADSALGKAFNSAMSLKPNNAAVIDYATYLPSYQDQAMFIASPIFAGEERIGVLIFQAPLNRIDAVMTSNRTWQQYGLGKSGETYLIGPDGLMRNDSRFLIEARNDYLAAIKASGLDANTIKAIETKNTTVGLQKVDSPASREALAGRAGFSIFPDYRGIDVLSAYTPVAIPGLNWALIAEIDASEAFAPTSMLQTQVINRALLIGLLVLIGGGVLSFLFIRTLMRSLYGFEAAVHQVMSGDRNARAAADSNDELGQFGGTLNKLLDDHAANLNRSEHENEVLNDSIIELLEASAPLRDKDLTARLPVKEDITGTLASAVNQTTDEIADSLQEIHTVAVAVEAASKSVKHQSEIVGNAAQQEYTQLSITLEKLAQASRAMTEIATLGKTCSNMANSASENTTSAYESVNETVRGLNDIRETIHETEKRIKRLGERSQEINTTVNIINNIAERTHVLALNASMQAAAAGDEGRAFAVIADEVQRLAESAREATSQISGIVENIQTEARQATETMNTTVSNVVTGSKVAGVAGEKMNATLHAANALLEAVQQIATYSADQVNVSNELIDGAQNLQHSVNSTHEQLQQQDIETNNLLDFAQKLLWVVNQFKLPHSELAETASEAQQRLRKVS